MPGEWQIERNQFGGERRFRIDEFGRKEYELEVRTAGGAYVPESQLEAYNAHEAEQRKQRIDAMNEQQKKAVLCPFSIARNTMSTECKGIDCALYCASGCGLTVSSSERGGQIGGKYCPITGRSCTVNCAVHNTSGCGIMQQKGN